MVIMMQAKENTLLLPGKNDFISVQDNLRSEQFHGLTPPDLVDIAYAS
jgi:hypothetical protein